MSSIEPLIRSTTASILSNKNHIDLNDNSAPTEADTFVEADDDDGQTLDLVPTAQERRLRKDFLKHRLSKRKYAKHSESRYLQSHQPSIVKPVREETPDQVPDDGLQRAQTAEDSVVRAGRLERGGNKVKKILKGRRKREFAKEGDVEIDILYENQRGSFVFGMPLFSSNSLLNFDPAPWVNAYGNKSSVNITNAQLPDPSWEWAWSTWFVDMSQDVDEQGWQYSFMFQQRFAWHGTHPWFHSFVRRRRWLRKRVRKHIQLVDGKLEAPTVPRSHALRSDYFSIHPAGEATPPPTLHGADQSSLGEHHHHEDEMEDIEDLPTLMCCLKRATVDREKINMILRYMDQGADDTEHFSDQIPHILSLFVFQHSRRQLLTRMTQKIDGASQHRKEHEKHHEAESEEEKRKIDNLVKGAQAADAEVRKLEYWSDIRDMVRDGEVIGATDEAQGWDHGWQGIDQSGPSTALQSIVKADDRIAEL